MFAPKLHPKHINYLKSQRLISKDEFAIKEAKVFCTGNVETEDKITYYPFYMIMFFQKQNIANKIIFDKLSI